MAWEFAAKHADRLQSLSTLSTPHPDAFFNAIESDEDQKQRSRYIGVFRTPGGVAESLFQSDDYQRLRGVYQGKLSESAISENIRRLAEPGALTSVLNWYRALNLEVRIGKISVPTLYIWGSQDLAVGEIAAMETPRYVSGPYTFERLEGKSSVGVAAETHSRQPHLLELASWAASNGSLLRLLAHDGPLFPYRIGEEWPTIQPESSSQAC